MTDVSAARSNDSNTATPKPATPNPATPNTATRIGGSLPDQPRLSDSKLAETLGYSGTQTATVVGITYRQLDYWARTDLIRPSLSDASGSGSRRRYSYTDLLELKTIKKLLDAGIKLEQVRKVFDYLREHVTTDIASAHLVIEGESVQVCDDGELIDVLKNGQGVLNMVFSMSGVKNELEADVAEIATQILDEQPHRRIG